MPFYAAAPGPSIDWTLQDGVRDIPIESREGDEVAWIGGRNATGEISRVRITPEGSAVRNEGFDVTPARLVSALITERGIAPASREGLLTLYPERQ